MYEENKKKISNKTVPEKHFPQKKKSTQGS